MENIHNSLHSDRWEESNHITSIWQSQEADSRQGMPHGKGGVSLEMTHPQT